MSRANRWGGVSGYTCVGCVLKPVVCSNGYLRVSINGSLYLVHRLVAAAFVEGDSTLQVNHKNGVRKDNRSVNLEWATATENIQHSYDSLDRKAHAKKAAVVLGGVRYESGLAAARAHGLSAGSIASALNRGHRVLGMEVALA